MRRQIAISLVFLFAAVSPTYAQSWGQLKSLAKEAEDAKDFAKAEDYWKKAIAACDSKTGPRFVQSSAGLAHVYASSHRLSDAESLYKAIAGSCVPGELSDDSRTALQEYALFLRGQSREEEATALESKYALKRVKLQEQTVALSADTSSASSERSKLYGRDGASSPSAKSSLSDANSADLKNWQENIDSGSAEMAQRRFNPAEQHFKNALDIADKYQSGRNYKLIGTSLDKLVQAYTAQEKASQAEPYIQRLIVIMRLTKGAESREYAKALQAHGQNLRKLAKRNEAITEEGKAERILAKYVEQNDSGNSGQGSTSSINTKGTQTGALLNRAKSASSGFNDATNQAINAPD